jgi:hypothetical protein
METKLRAFMTRSVGKSAVERVIEGMKELDAGKLKA